MKAHIQIVGWNHRQFLDTLFASCVRQTVQVPVLFVDNNSQDGSAEYVQKKYSWVKVIANKDNKGYAGGHNQAITAVPESSVAILLNPDIVLENNFTEEILKSFVDSKARVAVPLLLRDKEKDATGKFNTIIDCYGTELLPSLKAVNRYEKEILSEDKDFGSDGIWGFSGAAVAISKEAVKEASHGGQLFDELLHSYREDVDLSWRLRNIGCEIVGVPQARAWHIRAARSGEGKSSLVTKLSWRNYFFVLIKNASKREIKENFLPLLVEFFLRVLQLIINPVLWIGLPTFFSLLPVFIKKRKEVYDK